MPDDMKNKVMSAHSNVALFSSTPSEDEVVDLELALLLEAILFRYGYDFRHYAQASLTRRVRNCVQKAGLSRISELIPKVLYDVDCFELFLREMSVTVTEMFRDPEVFEVLRDKIISQLKTYSRINIWHAGCATGEEVYSLAILLKEEGLLSRCQIYATDFNNESLSIAEQGIYHADKMAQYTKNYLSSGGKASFSDYYQAKHGYAIMHEDLKQNITFAHHNLIKDQCFAQMHLIVCRNVLIYFDRSLQDSVLGLFNQSLLYRGYLLLGNKESLEFNAQKDNFTAIAKAQCLFQKVNYD
ncbi:protein-glutamate O-methyltransferase CheR [Vibrio tapetis subsp. quintayensis]|uniref:CheR family methyltransferase n=1 Tax=Vibrio tapetis TaxID=52443 RepID=UPI0025B5F7C7|nr:protein-glutamate O-methyltransferase CheR [Vibrio tapetis]MDN3682910.1 protein-glutamate O-methyltransferase CheR [Vibrio tapetis subsp. quintayensis]